MASAPDIRVSVVISTNDRAESLRRTLQGLQRQRHVEFEVVIVQGPARDGTAAVAAEFEGARLLACPELNISRSRNVGIAGAAGEVVAFIDDDAVPGPEWLAELAAAYEEDAGVAGAGGIVLDPSGVRPQYEFSLCDRLGETRYDRHPPFHAEVQPGADPFVYLQGTNMSFWRDALVAVGGFDEEIEYNYDEVEVCLRVIDAVGPLRPLAGAVVHHGSLASDARGASGVVLDPFTSVKNRGYFALRHAASRERALAALERHAEALREAACSRYLRRELTAAQLGRYLERLDAGLALGIRRGLEGERRGVEIPPADPSAFARFATLRPRGGVLRVAVQEHSGPGEEEAAAAVARELAALGHDVHRLTVGEAPSTIAYEDGVWVHRTRLDPRCQAQLRAHPGADPAALLRAAADRHELRRLEARGPVDLLIGPDADPLQEPALDPQLLAALLDPATYPTDFPVVLAGVWSAPPEAFAEGVYQAILGREPDPAGRELLLAELRAGAARGDIVRRLATSGEARWRGIPTGWLRRFVVLAPVALAVELAAAWELDPAEFAGAVYELVLGREPEPGLAESWAQALAGGRSRLGMARLVLESAEATARGVSPQVLAELAPRVLGDPVPKLEAVRDCDDDGFITRVHDLLLGRLPAPGELAELRRHTRRGAVVAIATSPEGRRLRIPDEWLEAAESWQLEPPSRRPAGVQDRVVAVRRALGRRRRELAALAAAVRELPQTNASLTARGAQLDALGERLRALGGRLDQATAAGVEAAEVRRELARLAADIGGFANRLQPPSAATVPGRAGEADEPGAGEADRARRPR